MRDSALLVSKTLAEAAKVLKPGMTTRQLDKLIADFIRANDAIPSFLNYRGYSGGRFERCDDLPLDREVDLGGEVVALLGDGRLGAKSCDEWFGGFVEDHRRRGDQRVEVGIV